MTVCDPGAESCRQAGWTGLPNYDRPDHLEPGTAVDGVAVTGVPEGAVGWRLVVENKADEPLTFVVDDSMFTQPDGTASHLVRSEARRWTDPGPQPPFQIAAHTTWSGVVYVARLLPAETFEDKARQAEKRIAAMTNPDRQKHDGAELEDLVNRERTEVQQRLMGGTLSLALRRPSRLDVWTAKVGGTEVPCSDCGAPR